MTWKRDIEAKVRKLVTSAGGNELMADDILSIIEESGEPENNWTYERISKLIEDYIDR